MSFTIREPHIFTPLSLIAGETSPENFHFPTGKVSAREREGSLRNASIMSGWQDDGCSTNGEISGIYILAPVAFQGLEQVSLRVSFLHHSNTCGISQLETENRASHHGFQVENHMSFLRHAMHSQARSNQVNSSHQSHHELHLYIHSSSLLWRAIATVDTHLHMHNALYAVQVSVSRFHMQLDALHSLSLLHRFASNPEPGWIVKSQSLSHASYDLSAFSSKDTHPA